MVDKLPPLDGRWGTAHEPSARPQCRYCGRADDRDCPPVTCPACGTRQCDSIRSNCMVCLAGLLHPKDPLTGEPLPCGYKECGQPVVAEAPRIRYVCAGHLERATRRWQGKTTTLADDIRARVAERDAGGPSWRRRLILHGPPAAGATRPGPGGGTTPETAGQGQAVGGCGHGPGDLWCGFCSWIPGAAEVAGAVKSLSADGRRCGRCAWACQNPHPGMYQRQMVYHARRHAEIEAMSEGQLCRVYIVSEHVVNPSDRHIGYAELKRRGIDPLTITFHNPAPAPPRAADGARETDTKPGSHQRGQPAPGDAGAAHMLPGGRMREKAGTQERFKVLNLRDGSDEPFAVVDHQGRIVSRWPGPSWARSEADALRSGTRPGPAASPAGLAQPATDAEFLESCTDLADLLQSLASQLGDWTESLAGLNLPPPVLAPLRTAADGIAEAANQASHAAQAFRGEFAGPRGTAAGGLLITGHSIP